jgi:hypothetical protein
MRTSRHWYSTCSGEQGLVASMHVHPLALLVDRVRPAGQKVLHLTTEARRHQARQHGAHTHPSSGSRPTEAKSRASQVRSRIRCIRILRRPSGVALSARPSTRTAAPSPSTSRLLPASNPRAGCRPASPPSPPSASNGLRPILASPLLPPRCQAARRDPEILTASASSPYIREMREVGRWGSNRVLRSHNPPTPVSRGCQLLQNRHI